MKFLFLPPEHDPDSYVRERGAAAFEQAVAQAVPLSRQLIEQAAEGQDLETAEGRARLLAQARPLWDALPAGLLREQLLSELAERARLPREDLARRWLPGGGTRTPVAPRGDAPPRRAPPVRAVARTAADRVAQMLLQRADWWHELGAEQHEQLTALPGWHAELFRWLERRLAEHGPAGWAELREPVAAEPWGAQAIALLDGDALPIELELDALRTAITQAHRAAATRDAMQLLGRA